MPIVTCSDIVVSRHQRCPSCSTRRPLEFKGSSFFCPNLLTFSRRTCTLHIAGYTGVAVMPVLIICSCLGRRPVAARRGSRGVSISTDTSEANVKQTIEDLLAAQEKMTGLEAGMRHLEGLDAIHGRIDNLVRVLADYKLTGLFEQVERLKTQHLHTEVFSEQACSDTGVLSSRVEKLERLVTDLQEAGCGDHATDTLQRLKAMECQIDHLMQRTNRMQIGAENTVKKVTHLAEAVDKITKKSHCAETKAISVKCPRCCHIFEICF